LPHEIDECGSSYNSFLLDELSCSNGEAYSQSKPALMAVLPPSRAHMAHASDGRYSSRLPYRPAYPP